MEVRGCIAGQVKNRSNAEEFFRPKSLLSIFPDVCCLWEGEGKLVFGLLFFLGYLRPRGEILRLGPTVWVAGLGSFSVQLVADIFLSSNFCRSTLCRL